ncbi:acyltransferase family protein [Pseudactinotalea suaedae]|uniref:acyltransferase family protein n=1 Tax=Pseudactinotalea suaedae TaxID=1524924 RepID=UPI0012E1E37E|nr:acyltransferase family protein [Pseudactinotalea suaedae]
MAVVTEQREAVATAARPRRPSGGQRTAPAKVRHGRILGLDGLRAIAVLAVLVFHLRPSTLPGGYLGVDIFFVLSGFLITTLLVRELAENGRLDLKGFWARRARRLLPALVVVVVVSTGVALAVGDDLLVDIRRQVLGALTFSNNWLEIGAGSSYFTQTAPQLFVNFWSLAVEEQFYLLWPVLLALLLAVTRTARQRVVVVLGVAALSATLMALHAGDGVTRAYYGTDTHAFGLMIGAALALSLAGGDADLRRLPAWPRLRVPLATAAGIGLLALLLTLDGESTFAYRGGILLASVLTAVVVASLGTAPGPRDGLVRVLSVRPMRWLGERSYGIYLWHWPVLLVLTAALPAALPDSPLSWLVRGLALGTTLAVAAASYRWIEQPIRRHGFRATFARVRTAVTRGADRRPRLVAAAAAALVVVFGVALAVAPDKSQVELQMEAAAGAVGSDAAPAEPGTSAEPTEDAVENPSGSAEEGSGALPSGEEITAFGDSMLYVAAPALTADFPGIAIDAKSNRQWPQVVEAIRAAVAADTVREVVVIVAGTNAGLRDPAPLEEALDLLGPDRRVVLVTIYHSSSWIEESNENLVQVASEHPNVVVADWYGTITQHLDQLQPDGVHPDMDGMHLFSDVVAAALSEDPSTPSGTPRG